MKEKRIICAILCLIMVFAFLPAAVFADELTGVWVGDVEVVAGVYYCNDSAGGIRDGGNAEDYNVFYSEGVLTLNDVSITKNHVDSVNGITAAVYATQALNIKLIGDDNELLGADGAGLSLGICCSGPISIEGAGSLAANGGKVTVGLSGGVFGSSVDISGGMVTANGGEVTTTGESYGIYCVRFNVSGGTVNADGGAVAAGKSYGVYGASSLTAVGGTVTATGGETNGGNCMSNGVYGGVVSISGGTVSATGGKTLENTGNGYSNGVYGGSVSISSGSVTAIGGEVAKGFSYGVYGNSSVSITGGDVKATGGAVPGSLSMSCGLYGINVAIKDGTVRATGGMTSDSGIIYGVYGADGVTVEGGTVTATGGDGGRLSCGVNGYNTITIMNGTLTATGGESSGSYGLYAPRTEVIARISISGGEVDATGATAGVKAGYTTVTGGTLRAYGDKALAYTVDSLDGCLVVGPAGAGKGLARRVSDALNVTDWSGIAPDDTVYEMTAKSFSSDSDYFTKHSVRIGELWAVSGAVKDAAGNLLDNYMLKLDDASVTNESSSTGEYKVYAENGTHCVCVEKWSQVASVSVAVNGAALSGKDITMPPATVTSMTVTPATASVVKGGIQKFNANVVGTGNPAAQTVNWTVEGGMAGTAIDAGGVLAVATGETASTITVKATSTVDTSKSVTASVTVTTPTQYPIIEGQNGGWTQGGAGGLRASSDADYGKFSGVTIDGLVVDNDNYTSQSGSTVVTLKASYLAGLSLGQHTLRIVSTDGYAEMRFTVMAASGRRNPSTGFPKSGPRFSR